jgi:exodeoxyribonuclease VII large subunit
VLIVARGGGSLEDLWAFNEERVARAIYQSDIPVISAVGHEVDYTIADFVADVRAPTPSAAAEIVIRAKSEVQGEVQRLAERLQRAMRYLLEALHSRLVACQQRRVLTDPWAPLRTMEQRLDELSSRLERGMRASMRVTHDAVERYESAIMHLSPAMMVGLSRERLLACDRRLSAAERVRMRREREELERLIATLQALSPLAVLARGYSICRTGAERQVIREASAVAPGTQLDITLWHGQLQCTVDAVTTGGDEHGRADV